MFTFECGQLFRREEFVSHFRNVHGDIHSGLNGWMEHRCPLAYYGCTYSQRRLCPSNQGSKVVHDRHLRSFGVQPFLEPVTEPKCDHLSGLPFEVLQHVARFLDGFSLCQLSMVSRTMRDVCASLLQTRGMVVVQWEKKQYLDGRRTWQIKDKVWRFSTAFNPVNRWEFADISSMADHLKRCPYNEVLRQVEAVPLPCMCTTRELTRDGRSLRSVLKPVS
ncbi:F-box only protein 30-like [Sinocyclocheilus rhinocerous]|uniref:F-box only protein 30-like n=1 Tax=Sinocyclocheilus rhinocerous TaxID=307959 RepID=UPI0007B9CA88|nr:PREDICTED: F-box only protein 30-like [Sinocyclocheilus rhinocerous]